MIFKILKLSPKRMLGSLFPIVKWSKDYDLETGICDLVAGVTVALTLVPQSIAYASLAGFEPQYGLYASFAGSFVYALLGTCPQINIGPTALLSLLTFTYTNGTNTDFAIMLCFIGGFVQLLAGISQLGFLIDFVSMPVVSGFTSAAAITIASSQIKGLLGLSFKAETFMSTWKAVLSHIAETRLPDTLLSIGCCLLLFAMKSLKDIKVKGLEDEKTVHRAQILQRSLWFAGVARNAAVVILAAFVAFITFTREESIFILTGKITPGLPSPQVPAFHSTVGNITYTASDMLGHLGSGLLVVPLVGVIANVAIAKAFSNGKALDGTQEIVALGLCNVIGAFFRSFPVNGSFTRSAVSDASGVRTPAAGFYTGIIVILTLVLLTPYFFFIPRAALASVIVCAVLHMVDIDIVKKLWRTNKLDLIPLFGTFISCLALGIELGLGCGVAIDILLLLYYNSRPPLQLTLVTDSPTPHYTARPSGGLHFAGADRVRAQLSDLEITAADLQSASAPFHSIPATFQNSVQNTSSALHSTGVDDDRLQTGVPLPLVMYCEALHRIDYTSLQSMKSLVLDSEKSHRRVMFFGLQPQVLEQFKKLLGDQLLACSTQMQLDQMLNDSSTSISPLQQVRLDTLSSEQNTIPSTNDTQL